jgi:hypothetical protein
MAFLFFFSIESSSFFFFFFFLTDFSVDGHLPILRIMEPDQLSLVSMSVKIVVMVMVNSLEEFGLGLELSKNCRVKTPLLPNQLLNCLHDIRNNSTSSKPHGGINHSQ